MITSAPKAYPAFASLKAFEVIGRLGSIRKAALALGVDHAGVSRHLKELELWAGVPLMDRRRGENGRLTSAGKRYHARISAALLEIDSAGLELTQACEDARLEVWCSQGFAGKWLARQLDQFMRTHREIELNLRPMDRRPDFACGEAAADIRFVGDWSPGAASHRVRTLELIRPLIIPVASPSFLAQMPEVGKIDDLLRLPLLFELDERAWQTWFASQETRIGQIRGTRLWHAPLIIEAAKRGQGVTLAHHFVAADELRTGELVEVLIAGQPCRRVSIGSYVIQARDDRWYLPALKMFREWLQNAIRRDIAGSLIA
jgi:DNA-binding transcriptional LysR family regulator